MDDKTNNERGITMLPMSAIEINNGQLKGLPKNPRLIKDGKYDKLKESITDYPEMLSWRSLLVYPLDNGKYIIVGGNMRYRAMKELGHNKAPVFIIPKETPIEKIKAYTILDNNGFGKWDWDLLANEWDEVQLMDWGVDLPIAESEINIDDFFNHIGNENAKSKKEEIVITIPFEMEPKKEQIKGIVEAALFDFPGVKIK